MAGGQGAIDEFGQLGQRPGLERPVAGRACLNEVDGQRFGKQLAGQPRPLVLLLEATGEFPDAGAAFGDVAVDPGVALAGRGADLAVAVAACEQPQRESLTRR